MSSLKNERGNRGRGRPRGFDEQKALEAAMLTFWEKGYRATSMDDLVARTGASRNSLYKTFGEKRDLFLKCLTLYGERFEERVETLMAEGRDTRATLRRVLEASAERLSGTYAPPGCLRCNSTLELMGSAEGLDDELRRVNDRFLEVLGRILARGAAQGDITPEDEAPLTLFFTGIVDGMVTLARSGTDSRQLLAFVHTSLKVLP
ncbi:MAG: TetR/AcrR family transcriptional regulator [Inquilinaceae bacterium]